ncbi:hypothetical protein FBT96_00565 [Rhodobacter capsulatus]|uniref:Mu-like prophage FluMu N-terminal domain-containing protein n=1 Tax=Rhodobacter capsulatus TaxID=1061 RepID=A0A4U1K4K8_RHOCA|nr:hypothetical protein [Rhodobacter capsulatus]TKD26443.1 hypothetical protein FBT96_00565 [Rhodobacter capsulatus]
MARSPKTKVETEAVAEETTANETDAAATEEEIAPVEPESETVSEGQDAQPDSTEDSLDTAQAADQAEVQPAPAGITVTITGPQQGRWRAGRHFSAASTVIDIDTLTEDELEALRGDPMLTIVVG